MFAFHHRLRSTIRRGCQQWRQRGKFSGKKEELESTNLFSDELLSKKERWFINGCMAAGGIFWSAQFADHMYFPGPKVSLDRKVGFGIGMLLSTIAGSMVGALFAHFTLFISPVLPYAGGLTAISFAGFLVAKKMDEEEFDQWLKELLSKK